LFFRELYGIYLHRSGRSMVNVQNNWRARPSLKASAGLSAVAAKAAKADGGGGRDRTRADAVLETAALPLSYTPLEARKALSLVPRP
jgi:hypothetical protein